MNLKRIAIIGAGPSGLVAAKECLEAGMIPTVFESRNSLGGIWNPTHGKTWQGMNSLLSHFHMGFSDFPMLSADDFPTNEEVFTYLHEYAAHFDILPYIDYGQKIASVDYSGKHWKVAHADGNELFDGVVMANGIFAEGFIPPTKGMNRFDGHIMHSGEYKNPAPFKNRHVTVIGGSYSGYEIATDLAKNGVEVSHIFNTPSWIAARYSGNVPFDLTSYRYNPPINPVDAQEKWLNKLAYLERTYGNPGDAHPDLYLDSTNPAPANIVIAEDYIPHVNHGLITPYRDRITALDKSRIHLATGRSVHTDAVIFCTGYQSRLPLDNTIAQKLHYNAKDMFQPLVLNKSTLHPELPSLAFTGLYRGPYFGVMEMQARWAAAVFSGQARVPDQQQHFQELKKELSLQQSPYPRPAFPRPDYTGFMLELANEIGAVPTEYLDTGKPMIPADFRRHGIGEKNLLALQQRTRLLQRLDQ